ncbi:MAG: glycosyltransferase family 39 protein [Deltaproteobacteria bacterium]|jgi:hypothetical protein|nr:glycosyltransferase family 39 protein [Deltaproteobacteria bacterium]MBW2537429.1 glycosyltransferase family 39 protein [Deltaproteobacteria bacterium]
MKAWLKKHAIALIALAAVLLFVSFDRLYRIDEIGVDGADTFAYLDKAIDWASGKAEPSGHYRPVHYFLGSLGVRLCDGAEHSVRLVHAILDIGSTALLFLLMMLASKSLVAAIAAALMYATLPDVVLFTARSELTRSTSTFFVVLSMLFFYLAMESSRKWIPLAWSFLLGISIALATNTHPELVLLGPGFAVAVVAHAALVARRWQWKRMLLLQGALFLGFMVPWLVLVGTFGFDPLVENIVHNTGVNKPRTKTRVDTSWDADLFLRQITELPPRFLEKYASTTFQYVFPAVGLGAFLAFVLKKGRATTLTLIAIPIAFHFLGWAYAMHRIQERTLRLFVPWLPWVMLWTVWGLFRLKQLGPLQRRPKLFWGAFLCAVSALVVINRGDYRTTLFVSATQRPTVYREAFDVLRDRVSPDRRALLAPVVLYAVKSPATHWSNFGENGKYMRKAKGKGLAEVMEKERAEFIVVFHDKLDMRGRRRAKGIAQRVYGKKMRGKYTPKKEYAWIRGFVRERDAEKIYESERVVIYDFGAQNR